MKEATGELNMTVIVIVAIAAIAAIFYVFIWPILQGNLTANARCSGAVGCGDCSSGSRICTGYYSTTSSDSTTFVSASLNCECE